MHLMTLYAIVQEVGLQLLTLYAEEKVWVLLLGVMLVIVSLMELADEMVMTVQAFFSWLLEI